MTPEIVTLATDVETGELYVDVIWRIAGHEVLRNDHIMVLRPELRYRNDSGTLLFGTRDLWSEMWRNIWAYGRLALERKFSGDHRVGHGGLFYSEKRGFVRQKTAGARVWDYSDPHGVLAHLRYYRKRGAA